ncbi:MAG: HNH endonuclease signature motif containing protein [Planctomycetia bacterium]|nr:HNH endonuclease signature motif containing protein [Planctomycetia bacterium]
MCKDDMNEHGLSRYVPVPVRRAIRQRCGFGCVICGFAIYDYEHVDPAFKDAKEHDFTKITLLCGRCHDSVTRGIWSKDKVKEHDHNPRCKQDGFSFGAFDIGNVFPRVIVGSYEAIETPVILEVAGTPLLMVAPPEEEGGPFRLSALFCDSGGKQLLRIECNEWRSPVGTWDIESVGPRLTFRTEPGSIALGLRSEPPGVLVVERMNMVYKGTRIIAREGDRAIKIVTAAGATIENVGGHVNVVRQRAGIVIDKDGNLSVGGG